MPESFLLSVLSNTSLLRPLVSVSGGTHTRQHKPYSLKPHSLNGFPWSSREEHETVRYFNMAMHTKFNRMNLSSRHSVTLYWLRN